MLKSGSTADDETRRYLKDKIRSAESFIRNVDRRKDTVSRITEIILEVQRDFFEDGKGRCGRSGSRTSQSRSAFTCRRCPAA